MHVLQCFFSGADPWQSCTGRQRCTRCSRASLVKGPLQNRYGRLRGLLVAGRELGTRGLTARGATGTQRSSSSPPSSRGTGSASGGSTRA